MAPIGAVLQEMTMASDPLSRPIVEIARDLRERRASARELVEAAIARHQRFGERLQAYSFWAPEQARTVAAAADAAFAAGVSSGPLQGLPVSLKDLFAAAGYPCFAGSSRRLPADPWERDGPLVATLRRQLGVIMGKTHMVEFAFGGTGRNSHHGAPYNPWDAAAHRSVGGSSSGAGVSLLEGSAVLAFGSDTAGSVRIPATMTGNAGLKVTIGRWSTDGIVPLSFTFDTPGLLARSVCDLAYGFAALDAAGIDPSGLIARGGTRDLTGIRLGVGDPFLWRDCDPGIAETVQDAVDALMRAGAVARDFTLPEAEAAYRVFLEGGLSAVELRSFLDRELPEWLDQLDPVIASAVRNAESLSAREYLARVMRLGNLARAASPRLDAVDVIASPTLCLTPPLMSDVTDADSHLRINRRIVRNTAWVNYLGLCAITMPVGRDRAGMPVGLQLTAPAHAEEKLLTIALAAERVLGTAADRLGNPPLLAS
jgi:aspartyl-tRNA(Asn)/glutamyl-tRNA(Gln) amidotransferase subunit A